MKKIIFGVALVCIFALFVTVLPINKWTGASIQSENSNQEISVSNTASIGFFAFFKKWLGGDAKVDEGVDSSSRVPVPVPAPVPAPVDTPPHTRVPVPTPAPLPPEGTVSIPPGTTLKSMTIDGIKRTYTVYVPKSVSTKKGQISVLIVLHGTSGTGEGIRKTGFDAYADAKGFITIYPDSLVRDGTTMWDPTNREVKDIDFLQAVIKSMDTFTKGNLGNVYVAGMSNGSVMTQSLGCTTATVDGIAAVSAGMGSEFFPYCTADRPLPYIGFYGTLDRFDEMTKYESSVAFFSKENGCTANYTTTLMPNIDPNDGTTVKKRVYVTSAAKACTTPVQYYRIEGGGHYWPGGDFYEEDQFERNSGSVTQDIDATKLIVEFFGL